MEQPVYYWDPVIAPSGMMFYTGDAFPGWKGSMLDRLAAAGRPGAARAGGRQGACGRSATRRRAGRADSRRAAGAGRAGVRGDRREGWTGVRVLPSRGRCVTLSAAKRGACPRHAPFAALRVTHGSRLSGTRRALRRDVLGGRVSNRHSTPAPPRGSSGWYSVPESASSPDARRHRRRREPTHRQNPSRE